jgi:hypothetical protein
MSHYKRSGRWLSILFVVGMLWVATPDAGTGANHDAG